MTGKENQQAIALHAHYNRKMTIGWQRLMDWCMIGHKPEEVMPDLLQFRFTLLLARFKEVWQRRIKAEFKRQFPALPMFFLEPPDDEPF